VAGAQGFELASWKRVSLDPARIYFRKQAVTDPTGESKERNREIAANESARQTVGAVRVSVWAIAVVVIIGLAAFGWVFIHNK
jgi:uncharacterized protein HemX